MEGLEAIFRWLHVLAGIVWIGHLYFFNWVNGPFQAKIDGPTKKIVNPELMPRALYWFRWGAAYTWITGVLLLGLVYYMGQQALATGADWSGQLGDGTSGGELHQPVKVMDNVIAVAAGNSHTFIIKPGNTVWGVGQNWDGELGTGNGSSSIWLRMLLP